MTGRWCLWWFLAVCLVAGGGAPLGAHAVDQRFGNFYGGCLHPLTALEHVLPLLALGLWCGQQGTAEARRCIAAFLGGWLIGLAAGMLWDPSPTVGWLNRGSLLATGLLVAGAVRLPQPAVASLAGLLAITHGFENVAEVRQVVVPWLFLPGVFLSGLTLQLLPAAVAVKCDAGRLQLAVRVAGSWIAAVGLLWLGLQ